MDVELLEWLSDEDWKELGNKFPGVESFLMHRARYRKYCQLYWLNEGDELNTIQKVEFECLSMYFQGREPNDDFQNP